MLKLVDAQRNLSAELIKRWNQLFPKLEELGVPLKQPLEAVGMPLASLNVALLARLEFLNSIRMLPSGSEHLVPENQGQAVIASLQSMKSVLQSLEQNVKALEAAGGAKSLDPNLNVVARNGATIALNPIQSLWSTSTNALSAFLAISPVLGIGSSATMANRSAALQGLKRRADVALKSATELLSSLEDNVQTAAADMAETKKLFDRTKELHTAVETHEAEAAESLESVRASAAEVERVKIASAKLSGELEAYGSRFAGFDEKLDERLDRLAEADRQTGAAEEQNAAREDEIDRLVQKSADMIRGATVAGLAASFGNLEHAYAQESRWARFAFYFAIAVLFFSVLPLALYLVPGRGLVELLGLPARLAAVIGANEVSVAGVIGRLVVLLPGTWLAAFCSRRYRKLFELKELYAHKMALAQSLEGFKREAPDFQQEIAAAVFWDLTQYADRQQAADRGIDSNEIPNPALRALLRKFEGGKE